MSDVITIPCPYFNCLTHWGRVMHICVSKLTTIGSDNGLSPGRRQAIIWTNAGILLIRPLGTNFNEMLIEIQTFSFMKMRLKMSSAKWRPFCLGLNVLTKLPSKLGHRRVIIWWWSGNDVLPAGSTPLTHWGCDEIDAISQTTFSNACWRMKMN